MKEIYLAGGCFWGTEHFLKQIKGVYDTTVGYANSIVPSPSYQQVCTSATYAAETVKVVYNEREVDLPFLIRLYFKIIDPTSLNQQGGDIGTQYRTGIYFVDEADGRIARQTLDLLAEDYDETLEVEVMPLQNFYDAEEYHQDYLDKNPGGYCHVDKELFELARQARPQLDL